MQLNLNLMKVKIKKRLSLLFITFLLFVSWSFGFISCLFLFNNYIFDHLINDPTSCIVNVIQIKDSYNTWDPAEMKIMIQNEAVSAYNTPDAARLLHRDYESMCIEWWYHNIGYYVTKPFCSIKIINEINSKCKDVDIEEYVEK